MTAPDTGVATSRVGGAVHRARSSKVLHGSAWILVGLALQSVLGFAFWLLGSRVASSDELGRASALYTAIQFVNFISGLGLTIALARHAANRSAEADRLFGWAVVAKVIGSVLAGSTYLLVTQTEATELVRGSPLGIAVFCAYTAGTSVGLLVDVRLMAERRWGWLVGRMAVAGLVRLPLTQVDVGIDPDLWLYHLMLAPIAFVGIASIPLLGRIGVGGISLRRPATLAPVARYSGVNWMATLASQAPQFVLPLVVAQSVPASVNASFFLAWTVTGLVLLVPGAIAQVLLVEGAKDADDPAAEAAHAAHRAREAMAFSVGLAALAWLGSLVVGALAVRILGEDYDEIARLLPVLMLGGIPWAVSAVRLSEARIRRDQVTTIAITATLGIGIVVPAVVLIPSQGTDAATRAWLLGNVLAALVATVLHRRRSALPHR